MKEFLIFRTDRVGDLLFSLILIKIIKLNHPNSQITLVASEKNFEYAKTFKLIERIIILKNNIFSKIKLILELRKNRYEAIIIHDGKSRSKFVSYFLNTNKKITCVTNLIDTQIEIIKKVCNQIELRYENSSLNFLDDRNQLPKEVPFRNYLHLHFDEKWIYEEYIKKYINIEPEKKDLINFINNLVSFNNLIITTGKKQLTLLKEIKSSIDPKKVKIFVNQELLELEKIVFNADLLIACHGWITHIASAKNIKQIDIIDSSYPYNKWTSHLRNYNFLNRKPFKILSKEILNLI